jgi:GT2 family glycosyltransferase
MGKGISLIIPNYNGIHLMERNIPSLIRAAEKSGLPYEIVIADDASTEETAAWLAERFPEAALVRNRTNRGFAPTANLGIRAAKFDFLFLVNNDISLTPEYFLPQLRHFEDKTVFGVMGRIMDEDGKRIRDAAKFPELRWNGIRATLNYRLAEGEHPKVLQTFFLSGANALMDREKVLALGGFDESFAPFYNEDVELSLRAWRSGWKCLYEDSSVCFHPVSATINTYHKRKKIRETALRNRIHMNLLHLDGIFLLAYGFSLLFKFFFSWLLLDAGFYRAFIHNLRQRKEIAEKREAFNGRGEKISLPSIIGMIRKHAGHFRTIKF